MVSCAWIVPFHQAILKEAAVKEAVVKEAAVREPPAVLSARQELTEALPSPVFVADRRGEELLVMKQESPTPPPQPTKREVKEKDKEVLKKVKELQERKAKLQEQRDQSKVGEIDLIWTPALLSTLVLMCCKPES